MSTSTWEAIISQDSADHDVEEGVDTLAHRTLISNGCHIADSCGQVIACWTSGTPIARTLTAASPTLMWRSPTFQLRAKHSGGSYHIRVRLKGFVSNGTGTIRWWMTLAPSLSTGGHEALYSALIASEADSTSFASEQIELFSSSSTSDGWIAASGSGVMGDQLLSLPSMSGAATNRPCDVVFGGDSSAVRLFETQIYVWAEITSGGVKDANLSGIYAGEYIGS
ncbi:MAG: hypothetical protein GY944_29625 [bacterium]|nr:hypothetical protein [bacterium]